jgi:hypothetical protein
MSVEVLKSDETEFKISDRYNLGEQILSTRLATLFEAVEKTSNRRLRLWRSKEPVAQKAELHSEIKKRFGAIYRLKQDLCKLESFGIDSDNYPFAVLSDEAGGILKRSGSVFSEILSLYRGCLEKIAILHQEGIECGDLCLNSFWQDDKRDLSLIGIMGTLDATTPKFDPNSDPSSNFLAPEQLNGGKPSLASDVFALGILGYYLLTSAYPDRQGLAVKDFATNVAIPEWCRSILGKAVKSDPADRFESATDLLRVFSEGMNQENKLAPVQEDDLKTLVEPKPSSAGVFIRAFLIVGLIAVGIVIAWPFYTKYLSKAAMEVAVAPHRAVASASLNSLVEGILENQNFPERRREYLSKIVESEDPVAHAILVALGRNSAEVDFRKDCENAIIERARRGGMLRSAEVVESWFGKFNDESGLPGYGDDVLMTLDVSLPEDNRGKSIRRIYAENPSMALYLAGAAAIDSNSPESYRALLAQLLGDKLDLSELEKHGALAIMLSSVSLSQRYGQDVTDRIDSFSDSDLLWALSLLARRDDGLTPYLAKEVVDRNLVPSPRSYLVKLMANRLDIPSDVLRTISKSISGELEPSDIGSLGRWYDGSIEKILLTFCATEESSDLLYEIFDTMASRELVDKLSSKLIRWIKDNFWAERLRFAKGVGLLALHNESDDIDLQQALSAFDRYASDKALLSALISSEDPKITSAVLTRYKDVIPISNLLILLSDPNKDVRLAAVSAASRTNELGALQYVIRAYEAERDPEVRAVYEEKFWAIKQRIKK